MGRNSRGNASTAALGPLMQAKEDVLRMKALIESSVGHLPPLENVMAMASLQSMLEVMPMRCEAEPKDPRCPGASRIVKLVRVGGRAAFICHPCYKMFEELHREQMTQPYNRG